MSVEVESADWQRADTASRTSHDRARFPDLVIIGQEKWDLLERRNQLLVRALATRHPHTRFLFAEQARRLRNFAEWRRPEVVPVASNIWRIPLIRPFPDKVARRVSDALEARQIEWAARRVGLDRPWLWSQDPHAADLLELLAIEGLIYDLTDDWVAFEQKPRRREAVQSQVERLLASADLVLACSQKLSALATRSGAQPVLVPNAIDVSDDRLPVPNDLARLTQPRLGYVGTLHSARLDVDLLVRAAELRPDWSFVFVGPDLLSASDRERLFSPSNVHHLGVVPHNVVQRYIHGFDIALIPNRVNEFTASLDPLKSYEYLAAGVPVVATQFGVAPELADHVQSITGSHELVAAAEALIKDNTEEAAAARRAVVDGQTWKVRAAAIDEALGLRASHPVRSGISVVVVSFNTKELLQCCLISIREQRDEVQLIVVDNHSTDGSPEMIRAEFPEVELVGLEENLGFAAANNIAFGRCRGEYVLLLNSDAALQPGALEALVDAMRRHPEAAAVGPRLLNPDGTLQRSAWPFPDPARLLIEAMGLHRVLRRTRIYEDLGIWDHREERAVEFLSGACLLLRADQLFEVGGFDERFYFYGEEADLQRRLRGRGWSAVLAPVASVTHVGGASPTTPTDRLVQFYGAQLSFLRKHRGSGAVVAARLALLVGSLVRGRWQVARVALSPVLGRRRSGRPSA